MSLHISLHLSQLRRRYLGVEEGEKVVGLFLSDADLDDLVTDDEGGSDEDGSDNSDLDEDDEERIVEPTPPEITKKGTREKRRLSVEEIKDLSRFNDWGNFETSCGAEDLAER